MGLLLAGIFAALGTKPAAEGGALRKVERISRGPVQAVVATQESHGPDAIATPWRALQVRVPGSRFKPIDGKQSPTSSVVSDFDDGGFCRNCGSIIPANSRPATLQGRCIRLQV
jgi:hypothetical protein